MKQRTEKTIKKKEIKDVAEQADAIKALSEMIMSGATTSSTTKKTKKTGYDESGNEVVIEETVQSIRPIELTRAIELMARLQGWAKEEDYSKVDKLLEELENL